MRFALEEWNDGKLRLYHEDVLCGEDVVIQLSNGRVWHERSFDTEKQVLTVIEDLGAFLTLLLKERQERDRPEIAY